MRAVLVKRAFIVSAARPGEDAFALEVAVLPVSCVRLNFVRRLLGRPVFVGPFAVDLIVRELALILVAVRPLLAAVTMLLVFKKFARVLTTIGLFVGALSVELVFMPHTVVNCAIVPFILALSMKQT